MKLSAIAAMSRNRVIGVKNRLPWHVPEDLKFFKDKTKGKTLIMGRKTFESVPGPLPHRENIILSRDPGFQPAGVQVFDNLEAALVFAGDSANPKTEIFIAGGEQVYRQSLPLLDCVYLTIIDADYEGDAFFPELPEDFILSESHRSSQEKPEALSYEFRTYHRQK